MTVKTIYIVFNCRGEPLLAYEEADHAERARASLQNSLFETYPVLARLFGWRSLVKVVPLVRHGPAPERPTVLTTTRRSE